MMRSNEPARRGDGVHEQIQENGALLALGHTPDIPIVDIALHLAQCTECRRFLEDISETTGYLPEALAQVEPPSSLRQKILDLALNDDDRSGDKVHTKEDGSGERLGVASQQSSAGPWWRRWPAAVWVAVLALVITANGAWWQYTRLQTVAFAELQSRHESNMNWLRSAEQLLVSAEQPAYRGTLQNRSPQGGAVGAQAQGSVAVYITPYDRVYVLIHADGLQRAVPYSTWLHHEGENVHLGDFTSTADGTGNYVYSADADEWEQLSGERIMLSVKDESNQQEILNGLLVRTSSPYSEKIE